MDNEIAITTDIPGMTKKETVKTGLGVRLKRAREALHLTEKEAAARLYLNVNIINIIENESFADGPPVTFMRGYLRAYARLLNIPDSDIKGTIDQLEASIPVSTTPAPALQIHSIHQNNRYISWITYLILLTLITLVSLWWNSTSKYVIADVPATNLINEDTSKLAKEDSSVSTTANDITAQNTPSETAATDATTSTNATDIAQSTTSQPASVATNPLAPPALLAKPTAPLAQKTIAQDNSSATAPDKLKKDEHKKIISNMALAIPEPG